MSDSRLNTEVKSADPWTTFWFTPGPVSRIDNLRRVAAAFAIFYLMMLAFDLNALCGPRGILPREVVANLSTGFGQRPSFRLSWLMATDSQIVVWGTWLMGVAAAASLAALWRPRWTAPATLLLVLMLIHRTSIPIVNGPFEWALTMLLLYLCFAMAEQAESWNAGLVSRLCQVHLTATYIAIGLSQLSGSTWWEGDAVWWLMANSESRLLNLTFVGNSTVGLYLINALTHLMVAIVLAFPVLVWTTNHQRLLLKIMMAYWVFVAILTGWIGYCGLMLTTTWFAFAEVRPTR
jgi:hypothetical protein